MNSLPDDLLLSISKFLDNQTCCRLSDLHKLAITNKYLFKVYKEKLHIIPLIPSKQQKQIYKKYVHPLKYNCFLCGPFNKTEVTHIIDAINSSVCLKLDFPARPKNYYPRNLQSPIHFDTVYEMEIFKTKVNNLNEDLNFLIAGRCCAGKGSTLYIKH
jgi:hypothetical protein